MRPFKLLIFFLIFFPAAGQVHDVIIRNGTIVDGTGQARYKADVAINKETIVRIGDLAFAVGKIEIDATGLVVAPGFINMLSWADGTLLKDGKGVSDLKQGVTLEVFGEGLSPGPRKRAANSKLWRTLGEYFDHLEKKGVSPNFASFVGATTVRDYVIGNQNRKPSDEEMKRMRALVTQAMEEGAMGVGSSLIYAPAAFATTEELIELCKEASRHGGMYVTHMRSESDKIFGALNETFRIAREADIPAEIYHLKINQQRNWNKIDTVLYKIDSAQKAGLKISANMYPYAASATGLKERIPTWAQEGGIVKLRSRIKDPSIREKILYDMAQGIPTRNSDPHDVMVLGFKKDSLNKLYKGKRLDEIAAAHGKSADETTLDLLTADKSSIGAVYFLISESNMTRMLREPYVSIGSDGGAVAITEDFMNDGTHPRAYGTFARFLGKYVRDEQITTLEDGVRRMTSMPAEHLKIQKRGTIKTGFYADIVVFDPEQIRDHATFENPHQYATGVTHVLVNGVQVIMGGVHTGALPGKCVRGPGWKKAKSRT
jgi:N-acyl-D-amino-acid deacylase